MEPPRTPPNPPNLPAVPDAHPSGHPPALPPRYEPPPGPAGGPHQQPPPFGRPYYPPPEQRAPSLWSRMRARSWRLPIGVGIAGAAGLLLPFFLFPTFDLQNPRAQWWPPFAVGIGALILLALLRLDRLLKGWTWHVAGLVFVAALVVGTRDNPWAWAFAASIAVLLTGLLRLPRWQLAAVGAVLCAVSVMGFSLRAGEMAQQQAQISAHAGDETRAEATGVGGGAQNVLPYLDRAISGAQPDTEAVCRILGADAERQLTAATSTSDCAAAVTAVFAARAASGGPAPVTRAPRTSPVLNTQDTYILDGCATAWAAAAGPTVGRVVVAWTAETVRDYTITGFAPC